MPQRPPRSTRTEPPFPSTTLSRSGGEAGPGGRQALAGQQLQRLQRASRIEEHGGQSLVNAAGHAAEAAAHRGVLPGAAEAGDVVVVHLAGCQGAVDGELYGGRSEEHTSELQSLMRISYAVFCLKKKHKEQPPLCSADYSFTTQETAT